MGADRDHRHLTDTELAAQLGTHRAQALAGGDQRREQLPVDPRGVEQLGVPAPVEAQHPGARRIGALAAPYPGEQVPDQIGDHQQGAAGRQIRRAVVGGELVQGVEGLLRDARQRELPLAGDALGDPVRDPVGAGVAIGDHLADPLAAVRSLGTDEAVVHGPGVHADRGEPRQSAHHGEVVGVGQALPDLRPQRIEIPAQVALVLHQAVLEAMGRHQLDPPLGDDPEHHSARGRAEVDRGDGERLAGRARSDCLPGSACRARPVDRRPGRNGYGAHVRARPVGPGAHRRNAAATPASTGTCRPVVCERSPAVSANTALATFSGSTSRFSRVRWA